MSDFPHHDLGFGGTMGPGSSVLAGTAGGTRLREPLPRGTEELLEQHHEVVRRNPGDPAALKNLADFFKSQETQNHISIF